MRGRRRAYPILVAAFALLAIGAAVAQLDGFEDDVLVDDEPASVRRPAADKAAEREFKFGAEPDEKPSFKKPPPGGARKGFLPQQEHYWMELAFIAFLALYGINLWFGRGKNEKLALAWATTFCGEGSVIDRNFSLIGPGEGDTVEVVTRDSASVYKLYASGRRYCGGMLATMELRARQDLVSLAWYLVTPTQDVVNIEVYMNDANMAPMVLLVGAAKNCRAVMATETDIEDFAHRLGANKIKEEVPNFPVDDLQVYCETNAVFYGLMKESLLSSLFTTHFAGVAKYFRYLHFTTENATGSHPKVLKFSFALPPADQMEALTKLMGVVPHFIDAVANVKLSPQASKAANERRQEKQKKANEEAKAEHERMLREKKMEKRDEEKKRAYRAGPEAAQKWEEAQEKKLRKREQRSRIKTM